MKSQEDWGEIHERAYRFFPVDVYDKERVLVMKVLGSDKMTERLLTSNGRAV